MRAAVWKHRRLSNSRQWLHDAFAQPICLKGGSGSGDDSGGGSRGGGSVNGGLLLMILMLMTMVLVVMMMRVRLSSERTQKNQEHQLVFK